MVPKTALAESEAPKRAEQCHGSPCKRMIYMTRMEICGCVPEAGSRTSPGFG